MSAKAVSAPYRPATSEEKTQAHLEECDCAQRGHRVTLAPLEGIALSLSGDVAMKTIACWQDLRPYGFDILTGEACGLMYRVLFDVTKDGRRIIEKCFGMPEPRLAEPWNRGSADDPHVGSIMLSREMLLPLSVFALLESGCAKVLLCETRAIGVEASDCAEAVAAARQRHKPERVLQYSGTAGDRNVHMLSGRTQ
jgi:hypothetical protein